MVGRFFLFAWLICDVYLVLSLLVKSLDCSVDAEGG